MKKVKNRQQKQPQTAANIFILDKTFMEAQI